jgi:F-type H+-transporting ATPase subunit b
MNNVYLLATASDSNGLLGMLGIDMPTLIFQVIAFLILVFVLGKWVFPIFVAIIDKREADIAASAKAADEAKKAADNATSEVADLLAEARREAGEIVATAKTEASSMVAAAESKAKTKADAIVAAARDDIDKEVASARQQLHNDMVDLVEIATEKVVGSHVNKDIDAKLIASAVKESDR